MNYINYAGTLGSVKKQDIRNIKNLFERIEIVTGVTSDELKSRSRKRDYSDARKIFFYHCVENLEITTVESGKLLNRDHSTVIHNVNAARQYRKTDAMFKSLIDRALCPIEENQKTSTKECFVVADVF